MTTTDDIRAAEALDFEPLEQVIAPFLAEFLAGFATMASLIAVLKG